MLDVEPTYYRRQELATVLAIATLYLALWFFLPKVAFWGLDNGFKFQGARAFSTNGSILVPYSGADFDPQGEYRPMIFPFSFMRDGGQMPVFPVLFMVLAGTLVWLFGDIGPFILPLFGGWACLLAAWFAWVRHRSNHDGRPFLCILGLGSPLLFYSLTLWEHTWAMALVVFSFALLSHGRRGPQTAVPLESFVAGLLIAAAAAFRTEAVLWGGITFLLWRFTSRGRREIWRYLLGLLIGLVVVGLIDLIMTGEVLPLHISSNFLQSRSGGMSRLFISRAQNLYILLIEGFKANHWSLFGLVPLFVAGLWSDWRHERSWWAFPFFGILAVWCIYLFTAMSAENRAGYTSSMGGLLWVVPFTVLALLYLRGERRRFWWLIWYGSYLFILAVAFFAPTVRGVHWGPRFIVPAIPLMLMVATTRAQRWWVRYRAARPVITLLVVISIVNQFYSFGVLYAQKRDNRAFNRWIAGFRDDPILTPYGWTAGDAALYSADIPWFVTNRVDRFQAVVDALRRRGVERINFLQRDNYIKANQWIDFGLEEIEQDCFVDDFGRKMRWVMKRLRIIPSPRSP